jgi:hypothetical protein
VRAAWLCAALCACSATSVDAVLRCEPDRARADCPVAAPVELEADDLRSNVWPNARSAANSDPWLVQHHDELSELRPRLLVLNFHNPLPGDALLPSVEREMDAIAEGSRYHGYADPAAPAFVHYDLVRIVDLTDAVVPTDWPYLSSTLLPVDELGQFAPQALFTSEFTELMGLADPAAPGRKLDLCAGFERGLVNEVWLAVADGAREPPLMLERKQRYDRGLAALPGQFQSCTSASGECLEVACGVTVRIAHLNPRRGPGCDLQVRGWSLLDAGRSIPYLAENADPFFNADFGARFAAPFDSLYDLCTQGAESCVAYPTPRTARSVQAGAAAWRIDPYLQGCGSPDFPPNATARWAWNDAAPVDSRCEHYQLLDGGDRQDAYAPYGVSSLPAYDPRLIGSDAFPGDCGGAWQLYWRQNMPGWNNPALALDGTPMKNWWPFSFY